MSSGESGLALACLNPVLSRKLRRIFRNLWAAPRRPDVPLSRANAGRSWEFHFKRLVPCANFPVRKKLRHGRNDLQAGRTIFRTVRGMEILRLTARARSRKKTLSNWSGRSVLANPARPPSGECHVSRTIETAGETFARGRWARNAGRERFLCAHVDAESGGACAWPSSDAST